MAQNLLSESDSLTLNPVTLRIQSNQKPRVWPSVIHWVNADLVTHILPS